MLGTENAIMLVNPKHPSSLFKARFACLRALRACEPALCAGQYLLDLLVSIGDAFSLLWTIVASLAVAFLDSFKQIARQVAPSAALALAGVAAAGLMVW